MFASLSRCQPSGHTVRSQEVTTGNFLFDQPIDTHRASLRRRFKKQKSRIRTWLDAYAEDGSPMGSAPRAEHKGAEGAEVCRSREDVAVFSKHLRRSALSPGRRWREMK